MMLVGRAMSVALVALLGAVVLVFSAAHAGRGQEAQAPISTGGVKVVPVRLLKGFPASCVCVFVCVADWNSCMSCAHKLETARMVALMKHNKNTQMNHWELSGAKARSAMANFFREQEVHSETNHLENYWQEHPFLGDRPHKSMSAAINRYSRRKTDS